MKKNIKIKSNKNRSNKNYSVPAYASGGALSGQQSGQSTGQSVGSVLGPIGGLVGGLVGGVGGQIFGSKAEDAQIKQYEQEQQRMQNQRRYDFMRQQNNRTQQDYYQQYGDASGITMFDVGGQVQNPNYIQVSPGEGLDNGSNINVVKGSGGRHQDNVVRPTGDTEYVWSNYKVPGTKLTFSEQAQNIDSMFKRDLSSDDALSVSTKNRKITLKDRQKVGLRQQQDQMQARRGGNKTKEVSAGQIDAFNGGGYIMPGMSSVMEQLGLLNNNVREYQDGGNVLPTANITARSRRRRRSMPRVDEVSPTLPSMDQVQPLNLTLPEPTVRVNEDLLPLPQIPQINYNPTVPPITDIQRINMPMPNTDSSNGSNNLNRLGFRVQEGLGMLGQIVPSIYGLSQSSQSPEIEPYESNPYEASLNQTRRVDRTPLYNNVRSRLQQERYNARQQGPGGRAQYNLEQYNRQMQEYNNINMQGQMMDNQLGMQYNGMLQNIGEQNRQERIRVNTANAQNRAAVRGAGARSAENIGTVARGFTQNLYQNRQNDILTPSLLQNLQMQLTTDEYNRLVQLIGG